MDDLIGEEFVATLSSVRHNEMRLTSSDCFRHLSSIDLAHTLKVQKAGV